MKRFGTEEMPLRASMLPLLTHCSWSAVMNALEHSESGKAADTGSAVHLAAKAWHKAGKEDRLAIQVMRAGLGLFPLADLDDAERQFRCYARDPRNLQADVILVEQKIEFSIAPSPFDPTKEEIVIQGTLDQVRREGSLLTVWDIKTGGMYEGKDMLDAHCLQLCAYQLGASCHLGKAVRKAGVIRTKDYLKARPGPVFWTAPWRYSDVDRMLDTVRHQVALVRMGLIAPTPDATGCKWCQGKGVANCLPKLKEMQSVSTSRLAA